MKIFRDYFFPYFEEGSGERQGGAGNLKIMQLRIFFCLDILENIVFQMLIQVSLFVNCSFIWFTAFVIWLINN